MYGYFSFDGLEEELKHDLPKNHRQLGRLFITEPKVETPWAQTILTDLATQDTGSITKAANFLKSQTPLWASYAFHLHRRSELIAQNLRKYNPPKLDFLGPLPDKKYGHWLLESENKILYTQQASHPLPWGEVFFNEDKNAPSRAYLKLWEVLTLHLSPPKPGTVAVDMGASPGGWTYVLEKLKYKTYAIDRSPLRDDLMRSPLVNFRTGDVFKIKPQDLPDLELFCSDVICYPDKLYDWTKSWLEHPKCHTFIITIKFQGKTDFEILEKFKFLPNSRIVHLFNNKHELTWICQR